MSTFSISPESKKFLADWAKVNSNLRVSALGVSFPSNGYIGYSHVLDDAVAIEVMRETYPITFAALEKIKNTAPSQAGYQALLADLKRGQQLTETAYTSRNPSPSPPVIPPPVQPPEEEQPAPITPTPLDIQDLNCPEEWGICFQKGSGDQAKKYHFVLLPAMSTQVRNPSGFDTPGASPGLQFIVVPSINKTRFPGFSPFYQLMGIDTVVVKMVGAFTGAESVDKPVKTSPQKYPDVRKSKFFEYGSYKRGKGDITGLLDAGADLDAYNAFQEFFDFVNLDQNEMIVEINMRRNKNEQKPKDTKGVFRAASGNPRFKGVLRKMEVYHARHDRTWYSMEFELTEAGLAVKECIDRNHKVNVPIVENYDRYTQEDLRRIQDSLSSASSSNNFNLLLGLLGGLGAAGLTVLAWVRAASSPNPSPGNSLINPPLNSISGSRPGSGPNFNSPPARPGLPAPPARQGALSSTPSTPLLTGPSDVFDNYYNNAERLSRTIDQIRSSPNPPTRGQIDSLRPQIQAQRNVLESARTQYIQNTPNPNSNYIRNLDEALKNLNYIDAELADLKNPVPLVPLQPNEGLPSPSYGSIGSGRFIDPDDINQDGIRDD